MSEQHEAALEQARLEEALMGDRLPLTRRQELRDEVWSTADVSERAALRAEYALAGWRICQHSDCQPDDCKR